MFSSSSFHFRKTKNMLRDCSAHKPTGRRPFRDVPHVKLTDILKSLRCKRLRKDISRRSSLSRSRSFSPPPADHDTPLVRRSSPDFSTSSFVRYRSDTVSILSYSSGMSTSSSGLETTPSGVARGNSCSPRPIPTFPTSPSVFQLRSASANDFLVNRLELHLRQLSLGDAGPDQVVVHERLPLRDMQSDVRPDTFLPRTTDPKTSPNRALSDRDAQKPTSVPHNQNVPMILITSVDAKHAKPLLSSSRRPSRMPFGPSNINNNRTNVLSATKSKRKTPDDPFTTQPYGSIYPPDYNLTFRLPSFPSTFPTPSKYAPETPTPMCCDHSGDCRGDLWEILHPPLVAGRFTLPPFKLPPLSTTIFDDASTALPC